MRTSVTRAVAVAAAALVAGWPGDAVPRAQTPANLVLLNGKVITVDAANSILPRPWQSSEAASWRWERPRR